jgi:hypothetical protein
VVLVALTDGDEEALDAVAVEVEALETVKEMARTISTSLDDLITTVLHHRRVTVSSTTEASHSTCSTMVNHTANHGTTGPLEGTKTCHGEAIRTDTVPVAMGLHLDEEATWPLSTATASREDTAPVCTMYHLQDSTCPTHHTHLSSTLIMPTTTNFPLILDLMSSSLRSYPIYPQYNGVSVLETIISNIILKI